MLMDYGALVDLKDKVDATHCRWLYMSYILLAIGQPCRKLRLHYVHTHDILLGCCCPMPVVGAKNSCKLK